MTPNRYQFRRHSKSRDFLGISSGWWAMTVFASLAFAWAIAWLLSHPTLPT
jgi:hypothetical protein